MKRGSRGGEVPLSNVVVMVRTNSRPSDERWTTTDQAAFQDGWAAAYHSDSEFQNAGRAGQQLTMQPAAGSAGQQLTMQPARGGCRQPAVHAACCWD
eukprot:351457-Chlamydomonas_euryale.AAC.7